ncbi:hypothetical protein QR98_0087700 [Sarcoptes scabiei]|uniref:Uncharacterized protein n=1 Tax=Sarcoptes scabiei TaxID=52283 RepID=A0A132AHD5_SARSC|nr:hypothetical protein QR98_0087700 [Sarcoptes scabiei]
MPPFNPPNVENATDNGMIHENELSTRSPKVTATAFDVSNSCGVNTIKLNRSCNHSKNSPSSVGEKT